MTDAEQIAAGLGKAAVRALLRIGTDWTAEGGPGPSRKDVYSLSWGRAGKHMLVSRKCVGIDPRGAIWEYRLNAKGAAVRAILQEQDHG